MDGLAGNLCGGIELAEGFQFVAEELESDGPGRGQRPDIDDAAAPREFALAGHLGFGLVALFLQPFDEVEGIEGVAALEGSGPRAEVLAGEGALQEGDDGGDDDAGTIRWTGGQADEGFEAFRDDVGVREFVLVGQGFPRGVEEWSRAGFEPGGNVGVDAFL